MKDWHKLVLIYLAGRKTHASPENIKQYLKRNGISKSHTAITTVCKESLSDILICHDQSLYDDNGVVKRKRFQYSLNPDAKTFAKLLKIFFGTKHINEFVTSAYAETVDSQDLRFIGLEFVIEQVNAALFVATAFAPEADIRSLLNAIVNIRSEVKHDDAFQSVPSEYSRELPSIYHSKLCDSLTDEFRSRYLREP